MAITRTGLDPWLGFSGTSYFHELTRQAMRVAEEMVEEAVQAPTVPRTVDVLRVTQQVSANTAAGIPATWSVVNGLESIQSLVFQPREWNEAHPAQAKLLDAQRIILMADVPAGGGILADKILTTDRVQYDDPTYGVVPFDVLEVFPIKGAGLVRVKVEYVREGNA